MKVFLPAALMAVSVSAFAQTPAPAKPKTPAATSAPKALPPAAPKAGSTAAPKAPAAKSSAAPAASAAAAKPAGKPVITIGSSQSISAAEFETFLETLPPQYRAQAQGPRRKEMAENLARIKLLAAEARKRGLDKDKTVQARLAFNAENLLAGAAFNDMLTKSKPDEATLRKHYDEHKEEYEQSQARHILIRFKGSQVPLKEGQKDLTEEEALAKANDLRKQLTGGADFAELAKKESDDTQSGAAGGELGTFGRGNMVPEFEKAAFSQPVGQISEPLKTQFGYHLIRVDKRDAKTFDEVRPEIEKQLGPQNAQQAVEALVKSANVTYDDAYFGPAEAPAPLSPAPDAPKPSN